MVLPVEDIETARKEKAYHWSHFGLVVVIRGHEELFFEFGQEAARDECLGLITENIDALVESRLLAKDIPLDEGGVSPDRVWFKTIQSHGDEKVDIEGDLSDLREHSGEEIPALMFDSNAVSMVSFKPEKPLRFTCMTIGSRGDVQPYIALCKVVNFFHLNLTLGSSKGRA
jgi:sterol 3beta-glucosyltransferase